MQERPKMLAPLKRSIPEPELLPYVRLLVTWHPGLVAHPPRLVDHPEAEEVAVRARLEALEVEVWYLA